MDNSDVEPDEEPEAHTEQEDDSRLFSSDSDSAPNFELPGDWLPTMAIPIRYQGQYSVEDTAFIEHIRDINGTGRSNFEYNTKVREFIDPEIEDISHLDRRVRARTIGRQPFHRLLLQHIGCCTTGQSSEQRCSDLRLLECEPTKGAPLDTWSVFVCNYGKVLADHGFQEIQIRTMAYLTTYDFTGTVHQNFVRYCYWSRKSPYYPDMRNELERLSMIGYHNQAQGGETAGRFIIAPDITVDNTLRNIARMLNVTLDALYWLHGEIQKIEKVAHDEYWAAEQGITERLDAMLRDQMGRKQKEIIHTKVNRIKYVIKDWMGLYVHWACRRCGQYSEHECNCTLKAPLCSSCKKYGCIACCKDWRYNRLYLVHTRHRTEHSELFRY